MGLVRDLQGLKAALGPVKRDPDVEAKPWVGPLLATGFQPYRLGPRVGVSHRWRGPEVGWERTDSDVALLERFGVIPPVKPAAAVAAAEGPAATGFIDSPKFRQSRGRYGGGGLTTAGRMEVSATLQLLQERRKQCAMWTITLPGPVLDAIARNDSWPAFQEGICRRLRRALEKTLGEALFVGVAELQPKRTKEEGRPCPHLHIVYIGRQPGTKKWAIDKEQFDAMIKAAAREAGFDGADEFISAGQVAEVKKSVRAYLSKYMTKGSDDAAPWMGGPWQGLIPRQWWLRSKAAAELVKSCTSDLPTAFLAWVWRGRDFLLEQKRIRLTAYPQREGVPATYRVSWLSVPNLASLLAEWQEATEDALLAARLAIGIVPAMGEMTYLCRARAPGQNSVLRI